MANLLPVDFRGDTLYLVEHNGEPFAPMKPLTEVLGLNWEAQHNKLQTRFKATMVNITIVAADGKLREMVCLPLRKLPAWLFTITPAKVGPALRPKIEAYQAECDDALWRYWTAGHTEAAPADRTANTMTPIGRGQVAMPKGISPYAVEAREFAVIAANLVEQAGGMCPATCAALLQVAQFSAGRAMECARQAESEVRHG
jgi:hypothetical protein